MGGSKTESEMKGTLSPEQRQLLAAIVAQVIPEVGQAAEVYGGQIAPGVSPLQSQLFSELGGIAPGQATAGLSSLLSGTTDPTARQAAYAGARAEAEQNLRQQLPYLEERYNAAGAGRSGGLEHALAQAAGQMETGLGSLQSQLLYSEELAARDRQLQGLGLWGGLTSGAGGTQRAITGEQLGEGYNRWLAAQPYSNPWVMSYTPLIMGTQTSAPATRGFSWGIGGG